MKLSVLLLVGVLILSTSCNDKRNAQNQIVYDNQSQADTLSMDSIMADTTKTLQANFPLYFDSTRVLIQPIGFVEMRESKIADRIVSKSNGYESSDSYAYSNGDYISGKITNLYFDNVDKGQQRLLTDKALNITSIEYLRQLSKKINRDYLLYSVYDQDNNRDNKLDYEDILACYISNLDGTDFRKITPDYQQYVAGVWMLWCSRYYFNTIEDINKDGKFDSKDKLHYYYVNFTSDSYQVVEYNPISK